jgi:hypothetical protein
MTELVVGIEQNQDSEIGLIAEDAADREARGRRVVERRGAPAAVEAAQVHRAVRLQLGNCLTHVIRWATVASLGASIRLEAGVQHTQIRWAGRHFYEMPTSGSMSIRRTGTFRRMSILGKACVALGVGG